MKSRFFTSCICIVMSSSSQANEDRCKPNLISFDVCEKAKEIQQSEASTLPQRLNANVTLSTVQSNYETVTYGVFYNYTRTHLSKLAKDGGSSETILQSQMFGAISKNVCRKQVMAAFIRLGGKIRFTFAFQDGQSWDPLLIQSCQDD